MEFEAREQENQEGNKEKMKEIEVLVNESK